MPLQWEMGLSNPRELAFRLAPSIFRRRLGRGNHYLSTTWPRQPIGCHFQSRTELEMDRCHRWDTSGKIFGATVPSLLPSLRCCHLGNLLFPLWSASARRRESEWHLDYVRHLTRQELELAVCGCSVCPRDTDEEQPAPKSRFSDISRPNRETAEALGGVQLEISIDRDRAEEKSPRGDTVLIADRRRAVIRRTILTAHALNFLLSRVNPEFPF